MNDRNGDSWGVERFVPFRRTGAGVGIVATITVEEEGPQLRLPGGLSIPLGGRFDLSGSLRATVPDAIILGTAAPDPVPLPAASRPAATRAIAWDNLIVSQSGFFVEGWMDDRLAPLDGFLLEDRVTGERVGAPVYRLRRPDVENHLQSSQPFEFGIWTAGRLRPGFEPENLAIAPLGPGVLSRSPSCPTRSASRTASSSTSFWRILGAACCSAS